MTHAMESRLRPAAEFIPAMAAMASALALLANPSLFLMPEALAHTAAAVCAIMAAIRAHQGLRVLAYRANLRRLPRYVLKPDQIPVSNLKLFWGLGFEWTQRHSQRLFDTRLPEYAKYLELGRAYRAARDIEFRLDKSRLLAFVPKITAANAWWNPLRLLPPVGGNAALHGVGMDDERPVYSDIGERVGHTLVLGTTRVGKTRLEELLVTQDIHRGDVVFVFDPKGDKELMTRMFAEAKRAGRLDDFHIFHLGHP
ncbi:MAG: conjugative coupling factor TraD, PFGI-1 class, partial [Mariprofundaceae bacterium]|nr:conjugative coupling factor TraD, PFGI-1 class [Mariprofundaceae bacterium]